MRSLRRFRPGTRVDVGLRPERLTLGMTDRAGTNHLTLGVADRIFLGSRVLVTFDARDGDRLQAELDPPLERLSPGERVTVAWPVADTHVFPAGDADARPESLFCAAPASHVPSDPIPSEHR